MNIAILTLSSARNRILRRRELRLIPCRHLRPRLHTSQEQTRIHPLILHQIIEEVHQIPTIVLDLAAGHKAKHRGARLIIRAAPEVER